MLVALSTTGCATKKYVREQTTPIQQKVDEIDKKHTDALNALDAKEQKDVSRVEERAMTAENKANDAAKAAQTADQHAQEAAQSAQNATNLAQQANSKIGDLNNAVQNIENYKQASADDVLFGFNKASLTKDAQQKLDQMIAQTSSMSRYILEVEGFTDRTGPKDYNLALSRRRADAVARYLVDHGVPLRRIHMIGLGETPDNAQMAMTSQPQTDQPAGEQKLSRKEQRRVVVRIWVPENTMSANANQGAGNTQR
jgi:outer membrane protein OmpA-like peptidoglycan-associated protein